MGTQFGYIALDVQSETNDISLIEEERENRSSDYSVLLASSSHDSFLLVNASPDTKGTPSDPGLTTGDIWEQWMHVGQYGLNTVSVWQDYTGEGVRVGLIDDGFNYNHSELSTNFRTDLDYDVLGNDFNSINDFSDSHGTWTSQVIGADDNGVGNVGVAYDADLVGIRRGFGSEGSLQDTVDAFQYALDTNFDIVNNSWGTTAAFGDNKNINFVGTDTLAVINKFEDLAEFGRGGLGANIVFSAGNGRTGGISSNYKNYQNSPYSISVGSINETGTYSYFSDAGANVLVVAPGESIRVSNAFDNGNGTLVSGTSFSAPAVSGVIALMLEANADLGYRDVQDILALSSRQIDVGGTGWANEGWQINGATNFNGGGMHFSHDYGFGLVDALAAVRLAESWTIQQTFTNMSVINPISASPALSIPATGTVTATINITDDIDIEHVLIDLDITHTRAGDLTVTLISPDGSESVLVYNINNGAYTTTFGVYNGINFEFSSVAHWGENSQGDWALRIEDTAAGNAGILNNWSLSFLGAAQSVDDLYVYTNEFAGATGARTTLIDSDGGVDTINAAAVTTNTTIDLNTGGTIAGTAFVIGGGTIIENAITGDGNDMLTGNAVDNTLSGGRGDDTFYGSAGNDTLNGGQGTDTSFYSFNISDFVFDLIDNFTVGLTNSFQAFTDTLLNMEFFNFNGDSYSRSELDTYVDNINSTAVETTLKLKWAGSNANVLNSEVGTFSYTGEDLGQVGILTDVLTVVRGLKSLEATVANPGSGEIQSVTLLNDDLANVTLAGFENVKLYQLGSVNDITANINQSLSGNVYTGSGHDLINIDAQDLAILNKWVRWNIKSGSGNDTVSLSGSGVMTSTKIYLGDGNDVVTATLDSKDFIYGGLGDDTIQAGLGDDRLYGDEGRDVIYGDDGNDRIFGGDGNDILNGGAGRDRLEGGNDDDILYGGDDGDILYGQAGNDEIHGGEGNDALRGQHGNDLLFGDAGNDKIYADEGNDEIHGGAGLDFIVGGQDDDLIFGDADRDKLYGDSGNDTIYGGAGTDLLNGGSGDDILFGGADNDRLYGLGGNDRLDGGAGNDILYAGYGDDILIGGDGADRMYGFTGLDIFALTTYDGGLDRIYNYALGYDRINITDILEGYNQGVDDLTDFIRFVGRADGNTELRVNADGDAGGSYGRAAIIYTDFGGLDTNDLLANGTLIADVSA